LDGDRTNWPIVVGITAGVIGGIVAGVALYTMHAAKDSTMDDAQNIIMKCHEQIKEIESSLERLKHPVAAS
jgi:hypothetical protein